MFIAYAIVGILLALALLVSARAKLTHDQKLTEGLIGIGVPAGLIPYLAACEIAGALGLLIGLWFAPLGIAAAIGVVLYFVGASAAHLRKSDFKGLPPALVMLVVSVAALILRSVSF
jgi:Flp pilus assembly protein TadB